MDESQVVHDAKLAGLLSMIDVQRAAGLRQGKARR
jgi:hypothetical protein